ncbi:MAG TPA: alpha/beta hydrolase [Jatrophihabitantaceae bacterium]|jgi:pimeloyl-ACP methyl ester carboxylesterase
MVLATRSFGEGRPIVLLPWFGLDGAVTAMAFEPAFADRAGWRRIYLDLPGTGDSPPVAANSDAVLDALAETVHELVGGAPCLLAGCSYGGYLAAGLVRRRSTQIAGLLLVCAGVKIRPAERNLSRLVPSSPQPGWLDGVPQRWHEHFQHAVGAQTAAVARRVVDAVEGNAPTDDDFLGRLRAKGYRLSDEGAPYVFPEPTMLVAGTQDRVAGYLDLFDALGSYSKGEYHALSDAGHYLPFEQPQRFAALVRDWLSRSGSARQAAAAPSRR